MRGTLSLLAHVRFGLAQRFMPASISNFRQGDQTAYEQHYTEKEGLLYFPPAPIDNDDLEGVSAARASQPKQRHLILYLVERGNFSFSSSETHNSPM